jgi:uncharacterized protein (DUF2141 family)
LWGAARLFISMTHLANGAKGATIMTRFNTIIAAIALNIPAITAAYAADAPANLEVAFKGIEVQKGAVMFGVYDSEEAYNKGTSINGARVVADKADIAAMIEGLPAGRYAIKAFHDIDGDGKMSSNPFGMPTEPFAFSNDAKGAMGPASWADAAFDVKAGGTKISITIK